MYLILLWLVAVVLGSFISGVIQTLLNVEITAKRKVNIHIYNIIDTLISVGMGYILLSAIAGHWLN